MKPPSLLFPNDWATPKEQTDLLKLAKSIGAQRFNRAQITANFWDDVRPPFR